VTYMAGLSKINLIELAVTPEWIIAAALSTVGTAIILVGLWALVKFTNPIVPVDDDEDD